MAIALIVAACSGDVGSTAADRYFNETGPLAEPATLAAQNWTAVAGSFAEANLSTMTSEEYEDMLNVSLDAANEAYVAYRDAYAGFLAISPSPECEEVHLATTEALSLASRGTLRSKGSSNLRLSVNQTRVCEIVGTNY
jgi:hypothetical protein